MEELSNRGGIHRYEGVKSKRMSKDKRSIVYCCMMLRLSRSWSILGPSLTKKKANQEEIFLAFDLSAYPIIYVLSQINAASVHDNVTSDTEIIAKFHMELMEEAARVLCSVVNHEDCRVYPDDSSG